MKQGFKKFHGNTLIILSEYDLVAQEFITLTKQDTTWRKYCNSPLVRRNIIKQANHTFSSQFLRNEVYSRTTQWMSELNYHHEEAK
jgi:hypothetical protein